MSPYDRVVGALMARKSRRMGDNWTCPSHDDRIPSLSVKPGTHRNTWGPTVLIKCHAGCSIDQIAAALGIELSDLFGNGHRQTQLFPPSQFSPVGVDILCKLPAGAERSFIVTSALGRFVGPSGGRERVYSRRQITAVIVEAKHRQAAISTLGISRGSLRNDIARWKEWGVAHGCSRTVLTIFVRKGTACPVCKTSLVGDVLDSRASLVGDVQPPPTSLDGDASVPSPKLTDDGFDIGVSTDAWEPYPEVKALEWLKDDMSRRRR